MLGQALRDDGQEDDIVHAQHDLENREGDKRGPDGRVGQKLDHVLAPCWSGAGGALRRACAHNDLPPLGFPTPQVDYVTVDVDITQDPLCLPNAFTLPENVQTLQFIAGTEPTKTCTTPTSCSSSSSRRCASRAIVRRAAT